MNASRNGKKNALARAFNHGCGNFAAFSAARVFPLLQVLMFCEYDYVYREEFLIVGISA